MESLLKLDIIMYCIFIIVYFEIMNMSKKYKKNVSLKLLTNMSYITISILVARGIFITLISKQDTSYESAVMLFNGVYQLIATFNVVQCTYFVFHYINKEKKLNKKSYIIAILTSIIYCLAFTIVNYFTRFAYDYTVESGYKANPVYIPLFSLIQIILSILIIYLLVAKAKNKIPQSHKILSGSFVLFITIASYIELRSADLTLIGSAYVVIIITINHLILSNITNADSLTGAINRRTFNNILDSLKGVQNYALAFIDMDDLKIINDTYGHSEGDKALSALVEIVNEVIEMPDIIARYGGDEFVIVFNTSNLSIIEGKLSEIEEKRIKYNEENKAPYKVSFSTSYGIYDPKKFESANDLLKYVDNKMYDIKFNKKQRVTLRPEF